MWGFYEHRDVRRSLLLGSEAAPSVDWPRNGDPLIPFLVLTFAISWCAWIPALLIGIGRGAQTDTVFVVLQTIGAAGPSVAAIVILQARFGAEWRRLPLFSRYRRWRVGIGWFGAAVLLVPGVTLASAGIGATLLGRTIDPSSSLGEMLSDIGPAGVALTFLPQLAGLMLSSPLLEELGWRGFLLPSLQERLAALPAAILVGAAWAFWHLPLWIAQGEPCLYSFALIVLHSILMTCIFNATRGSMLIAMVFHASLAVALTSFASGSPNPIELAMTGILVALVVSWFGSNDLAPTARTKWRDLVHQ